MPNIHTHTMSCFHHLPQRPTRSGQQGAWHGIKNKPKPRTIQFHFSFYFIWSLQVDILKCNCTHTENMFPHDQRDIDHGDIIWFSSAWHTNSCRERCGPYSLFAMSNTQLSITGVQIKNIYIYISASVQVPCYAGWDKLLYFLHICNPICFVRPNLSFFSSSSLLPPQLVM